MTVTHPHPRSGEAISGSWKLAPERSSIGFRVRLLWGIASVKATSRTAAARSERQSRDRAEDQASSVYTGNRRRDPHLRSSDFFDAENHPEVRLVSDSATVEGDALKVSGRLYARGESIPLRLDAQIRHVDGELEIEAATIAPHRALGMTWNLLGLIPARSELFVKACLIPMRQTPQVHATADATEPK